MIATLRQSSFSLSKQVGLTAAIGRSEWRRRRLLILCYHGVALADEHRWNPQLYVSADTFARRMAILRRTGCDVLPLGAALERLQAGTLPDRAVALTFDDGYYDFLAKAYPVLQQHDFPATVYLTTARCEHNFPVVNLFLSYALWSRRGTTLDGRGLVGLDGSYSLGSEAERQAVVNAFARATARMNAGPKDDAVRRIVERLDLDYDALFASRVLRLMTPEEVRATAGPLVDFQLHTHLHRTPPDADLFIRDVRLNRERIEAMTGRPATHFCYPSGVYRMQYLPVLAREGIVSATTCDPGIASRQSPPLLLPRFVDTEMVTDVEFEAWATGSACWLPRRTRRAHAAVH